MVHEQQGRDAGPGRERPLQPARYGFRAVPGMRTRLHGIQHDQTHRAILHGIAQVRSHGSIGRAPIPEQFAHPVAAVMVAGHGVHRQGKRCERLMQQAVGVRVPAVGQVARDDQGIGLLNKRLEMLRNDPQAFKGIHHPERKATVAAQMKIGKMQDTHFAYLQSVVRKRNGLRASSKTP